MGTRRRIHVTRTPAITAVLRAFRRVPVASRTGGPASHADASSRQVTQRERSMCSSNSAPPLPTPRRDALRHSTSSVSRARPRVSRGACASGDAPPCGIRSRRRAGLRKGAVIMASWIIVAKLCSSPGCHYWYGWPFHAQRTDKRKMESRVRRKSKRTHQKLRGQIDRGAGFQPVPRM